MRDVQKRESAAEREARYRAAAEGEIRASGGFKCGYVDPDTGQFVVGFAGNVRIFSKGLQIRAENVVVWCNREKLDAARMKSGDADADQGGAVIPLEAAEEIYADEDVTVEMDHDKTHESVRADRFFYDLKHEQAIFVDGYVESYADVRGRRVPLFLRAEEIRQLGAGYFVGTNASITNCSYGEPHWHVHASEITLDTRTPGAALYRADNASFRIGDFPIFWLPFVQGDLNGGSNFYFKGARVGHSTRLGTYALTEWGDQIRLGSGKDRYTWGDWTLHLDPMEKRGMGVGLDVDYQTAQYFGRFRSYYLHDTGESDKNDQPIDDRSRGRVRLQHRQEDLPFGFEGTAEISYLTDENFLNEFFEREAKTGKEQETVAYLKKTFDDQAFTVLGKWRINDFQTTTEYLPQAGYRVLSKPLLPGTPLGTNLYFTDETELANVRFSPSTDLAPGVEERRQTTRFDTRNQLNVPASFGDFNLNPFVEGRYTVWGEPADPQTQDVIARVVTASGFRLDTQAWRNYDANVGWMRVHGVRHVINPEIAFLNRWAVTQSPDELIQFDEVDAVKKEQFVELSVRNRLETRGGETTRTFFDWRMANRFFPDAERDDAGDPWGHLENDVRATLSDRLLVLWDSEYDWYEHAFASMNTGVRVRPTEEARVLLQHRFVRDTSSIVAGGLEYRLSEKWIADVFEQFDTEIGRELENRFVLQRYTHDWVFEFEISVNHNQKDTRVSVAVYPRDYFFGSQRQKRGFDEAPFFDRGAGPVHDSNR
ncbi:MAG: LPS-assembly protein LptD [Planctomycetes bacterium]|nr:LPS-assembly protein LptD [Planctomycetota bacterium]